MRMSRGTRKKLARFVGEPTTGVQPMTSTIANGSTRMAKAVENDVAAAKDEFESRAGRIRNEIAALATSMAEAGESLAGDLSAGASATAREMRAASQETLQDLRNQMKVLERQAAVKMRQNPMAALAMAAGAGFLLAMLARR
jgi:ElaB/YqjD/DUF883 family membrane-anchored ribosome-binding protein